MQICDGYDAIILFANEIGNRFSAAAGAEKHVFWEEYDLCFILFVKKTSYKRIQRTAGARRSGRLGADTANFENLRRV